MDGRHFDALTRGLATGVPRRNVLRTLAVGLAGLAGGRVSRNAEAKPNPHCRKTRQTCTDNGDCCSNFCPAVSRAHKHKVCEDCDSGIVCGSICCPVGAVNGCSEINGPNGPVIGCLCPNGAQYDHAKNECVCSETCETNDDCCSGKCCDGVCCAEGQDLCCAGVCADERTCSCPPGSTACADDVICHSFGKTVSNPGMCCAYPYAAFCCAHSHPHIADGIVGCCLDGVDCPDDGRCPDGVPAAYASYVGCCESENDGDWCAPDGDCCYAKRTDFFPSETGELTCILPGDDCDPDWPCCGGGCGREGKCGCAATGAPCTQFGFGCCSKACDGNGDVCL